MLKTRILTALVLVPLAIAAIWYLPTAWVAALIGALMLGCAWEWTLFIPLQGVGKLLYLAATAGVMALLHPWSPMLEIAPLFLVTALCWWLIAALWLGLYPRGFTGAHQALMRMLIGLVAMPGCYLAIWNLHTQEQGRWLVFLMLAIVWATDTGGYFAGKRFGKRKLAVQISPNKTWEGLWGGVALAGLLAVVAGVLILDQVWWQALMIGVLVALVSVVGDLTISMFKRQCGVKDTGKLFPGHGGALDRLDSMLAAAPVLVIAESLLRTLA